MAKSLDKRIQVDVVYTDFEKAFDKVCHKLLLKKLSSFGLSDGLTHLFESYLCDRRQFVIYGGCLSREYFTTSGVPQGSNLGPLLFLLFINDINTAIRNSQFLLYADDLKLIKNIQSVADFHSLQRDLDSLWRWASFNRLPLSVGKCQIMSFSRSRSPSEFSYCLGGNLLARKTFVKDLGVIFESEWKFSLHIDDVCARSSKMLGFVMRNAHYFDNPSVMRVLYDTLVRSILESGSIIWSPRSTKYSLLIEKIQKRFLRYLYLRTFGRYPFLYPSAFILGALGYDTLTSRRKLYIAKHFFKLIRGVVDNPTILEEVQLWVPEIPRESRSRPIFMPVRARTSALADSPMAIAIQLLNKLALHIDLFNGSYNELVRFMSFNYKIL